MLLHPDLPHHPLYVFEPMGPGALLKISIDHGGF